MSTDTLHIETGRYNGTERSRRYCKACCSAEESTVDALLDLPFTEIPIEAEEHVLLFCPEYDNVRESAPISLLNDLKQDVSMVFNDAKATYKLVSFIQKIMSHRKQSPTKDRTPGLGLLELAVFSTSFFLSLQCFVFHFYVFYVMPLIHIFILVFSCFIFGLKYINVPLNDYS